MSCEHAVGASSRRGAAGAHGRDVRGEFGGGCSGTRRSTGLNSGTRAALCSPHWAPRVWMTCRGHFTLSRVWRRIECVRLKIRVAQTYIALRSARGSAEWTEFARRLHLPCAARAVPEQPRRCVARGSSAAPRHAQFHCVAAHGLGHVSRRALRAQPSAPARTAAARRARSWRLRGQTRPGLQTRRPRRVTNGAPRRESSCAGV